jgi:hypothetical protein
MNEHGAGIEVPPRVLEFLGDNATLTLATASPTGVPRATTLRYVNDGLNVYVWMRSQAWAAKQIEQNPLVSFTISREDAGLQGTGQARVILNPDELERVVGLFGDKFPTALGSSTMNVSFFRIVPSDMKLVNETYGGGRGETQLLAGAAYEVQHVYNVLSDLPATDVGLVAGILQRHSVKSGTVVARQGAPADKFVIVVEGTVEVTREGENGSQQHVADYGAGDFIGEVAILTDSPRTHTITAKSDAELMLMERDEFRAMVAQSLGATGDFDRIVRERLGAGTA